MGWKREAETKYIYFILIFSIIFFCVATVMTSHIRHQIREEQEMIYNLIQSQHSARDRTSQRNTSSEMATNQLRNKYREWFSKSLSVQIDTIKAMRIKKRVIAGGMSWKRTFSNSIETVKEINSKMYRTRQSRSKLQMKVVDNCAVVGNGGALRNSRCGDEIDVHDFVFRINMAPIDAYKRDVGSKVDFMALNSQGTRQLVSCMKSPTIGCSDLLQTLGMLEKAYLWFSKYTTVDLKLSSVIYEHVNTTIIHPKEPLGETVQKLWNTTRYPSSGLFVYSLATTMCKRISLYGFYPFSRAKDGRRLTYNYYTNISIGEFEIGHDIPNEYQLLQDLHKQRMLRLVTNPCPRIEQYEVRNRKVKWLLDQANAMQI